MSGGSYNYLYLQVESMAESLEHSKDPTRLAFAKHLRLVAAAMHDVEWVDSNDRSKGSEHEAIHKALGTNSKTLVLMAAVEAAEEMHRILILALRSAKDAMSTT